MKRYKCELFCRITAFHDMIVEADSPQEATARAIADAKQLSSHDWDLGEVEDIDLNTLHPPLEVKEEEEHE